MFQAIDSVAIYVHNQTEAVRFYRDLLGFEVRRYEPLGPAGSWIEMALPGSHTALVLYPQALMPDFQSRRAYIVVGCEDLHATYETLSAAGVTFVQEPAQLPWGIMAIMADPYGNELVLMQVTRAAPAAPGGVPRPPGGPPPPPPG